jgi:hypothetical protein
MTLDEPPHGLVSSYNQLEPDVVRQPVTFAILATAWASQTSFLPVMDCRTLFLTRCKTHCRFSS